MLTVSHINDCFKGDIDTAALMQKWSPTYRDELIAKYGTSKEELVDFFGKTRDELIAENTDAWIRLNRVSYTAQTKSKYLFNPFLKYLSYYVVRTSRLLFINFKCLIPNPFSSLRIWYPTYSQFNEFIYFYSYRSIRVYSIASVTFYRKN